METNINKLRRLSFFLLFYTLLVIIWGAWVRISHSGDGCGDHWPLCQGALIPQAQTGKTWIEYAHRMMSGLYGILVIWVWFQAKKIPAVKKIATAVLIFMITEALLGAKLVLLGLVRENGSPLRAFAMGLHFTNSLLLVGSIALLHSQLQHINYKKFIFISKIPWLFLILGTTGALAALSNTLFPSESLWQGLQTDFKPDSHYLLRLRVFHPLLGLLIGGSLILMPWLKAQSSSSPEIKHSSMILCLSATIAVLFGGLTLLLLSPVWMKLTHLLLAHILWILLVRWMHVLSQAPPTANY